MNEERFLTFHDLKGDTVLVRQSAIQAVSANAVTGPAGGGQIPCTVLMCPWGGLNVKEPVEQVEAMIVAGDFQ